jgi:DNA-binding CsgD family transcriptional regulator
MVGDVLSEQIGRPVEALWPGREDICSRVYDCAKGSCNQVETEAPLPATTRHRMLQMTFTAGSAGRVTIHIQDVTASSRAREMQRIQRELALSVAATSDLGDALTSLAHCAARMQGIDIVGICSWVEEEERFEVLAVEGMDEQLEGILRADPLPEGILADGRLYSGQPIYGHMSDFLDIEGLTGELLEGLGGYGILPILDDGQLLATLNVVSRTYEHLPQSVRGPLESLVLRMGPVVGRIRMAHALEAERHAQQEANVTLRGVLARIEDEKAQTARSVASNVDHHILPLLDELDHHLRSPDQQRLLKLLRAHLDEVTGSHTEKLRRTIEGLTPTELRVCDMIRRGLASKEIARVLHISPVTVSRHRDNIRKKLDLVGKKVNLASYLRSIDLDVDRS